MFQRILIANRGEIALRVIRACKELGIESVGVYSEEDSQAIYLRFADETLCIGPSGTSRPYLDIPTLIAAAEIANVDAIHPGYGFLAENAHFAEICQSCNLKFIGPTPETIGLLGNKAKAREVVQKVGVPVVPGSSGLVADEEKAISIAGELGFPVLIKASAGGGGRGMRIAQNEADLRATFQAAKSEAQAAFKNGDLYVEKLIERPRHVEIQILGDQQGNVVFLGERDCSLQRRHQKLVEESPSPAVDPDLRRRMGEAAVRIAKAVGYEGAGTVEFLLAPNGDF
ncbi:MAG TPA: ATP-grasp domain-containing protein, partial [Planctomycetes bacterium]|nr:ATP-grasp domain-containing protein [Planctomycetota bacterium]